MTYKCGLGLYIHTVNRAQSFSSFSSKIIMSNNNSTSSETLISLLNNSLNTIKSENVNVDVNENEIIEELNPEEKSNLIKLNSFCFLFIPFF